MNSSIAWFRASTTERSRYLPRAVARVAALGVLVPGQMRRQRGDRQRTDAGRFLSGAFEQKPRGLRDLFVGYPQRHPQAHHVGGEDPVLELHGKNPGDVRRACRRVAEPVVTFGGLSHASRLGMPPLLLSTPADGLGTIPLLAAVALAHVRSPVFNRTRLLAQTRTRWRRTGTTGRSD
ncbi:MAG TPA: hypothetical protein VN969_16110 [Streptosporangiaceae bacterium]|nr:hypothetical protein [Streptosporangiaceae bacterium]